MVSSTNGQSLPVLAYSTKVFLFIAQYINLLMKNSKKAIMSTSITAKFYSNGKGRGASKNNYQREMSGFWPNTKYSKI